MLIDVKWEWSKPLGYMVCTWYDVRSFTDIITMLTYPTRFVGAILRTWIIVVACEYRGFTFALTE